MYLNDKTISKLSEICCVYSIKNTKTGYTYLGSTINVYSRFHNHKSKLLHNKHENDSLQNDYNLLGINYFIFEILVICSKENLQIQEQLYLNKQKLKYNLQPTAYSNLNYKHLNSAKLKVSDANSGCNNGQSKLNKEQVLIIRKSKEKGKILSQKYNISCAQISMVRNYKSYINIL